MNLFFLAYDSAFYWVRASALSFLRTECGVRTLFRHGTFPDDAVFVFNRFCTSRYFRTVQQYCRRHAIPYVVDVDDLFWSLPGFSSDPAAANASEFQFSDRLVREAYLITTSTETLAAALKERYPESRIVVVENCPGPWVAPQGAALIVNTDAFKMGEAGTRWFAEIAKQVMAAGLPLQLLGSNSALSDQLGDGAVFSHDSVEYRSYLHMLASHRYALALLPVETSQYADCKSSIKAMEFCGQHIPTIASDIEPYRIFKQRYPELPFTVVENTPEAWRAAVDRAIAALPREALERGQAVQRMLRDARMRQIAGWREALAILSQAAVPRQPMRRLRLYLRFYSGARDRLKAARGLFLGAGPG